MIGYKYGDIIKVAKGFYQFQTVYLLKKVDNKYMACFYHGTYNIDNTIILDETELGEKVDIYA